ncbi:ABC transporter permease [Paenibacillus allorhizosphaerae]|uniref:Linearmycin resistance permease protein LnrN n=1 Tax=Paenibacillus allorhizosphaerae TaxID=2849866 RepID=A0ABN7TE64_9BACL|nr:ABC transporter permease [Paenibacillus allorhizosphaerae]CAG7622276.1 Linearmycin resistance permease protein LnrN [Paenibacillus allorhizosphaerae]
MNSLIIALGIIKRTIGNRKGILLHILVPALVISALIGLMGDGGDDTAQVLYMNRDTGAAGSHLIKELGRNDSYRLSEAASESDIKEALLQRKAAAAFIIPPEFTDRLLKGSPAPVELSELTMSEASFALRMNIDHQVGLAAMQTAMLKTAGEPLERMPRVFEQTEKHQVTTKTSDLGLYSNASLGFVTGFLLMFLMGLVNTSVSAVIEDRKRNTMTRMFAAPVRSGEIALGNFLGSFLLGTLQIVVVLAVTKYAIGYRYGLPFWEHLLLLEFFLLAVIGISSSVAGFVRNSENLSAINAMIATPTCMLGGCFWPVAIMPEFMQKLSHFVPQSWAIEGIKRLASGQSIEELWMHLTVLALFAVVLLGLGSVVLKPGETDSA